VTLPADVSFSGSVVDETGQAVPHLELYVELPEPRRNKSCRAQRSVWTDGSGRFLVREVPPEVEIHAPGVRAVNVRGPGSVVLTQTLRRWVDGRVIDSAGAGVGGIIVDEYWLTGSDGRFDIEAGRDAEHTLVFSRGRGGAPRQLAVRLPPGRTHLGDLALPGL
jgi:hypothetical protein